jgi:hypothetical protein
MLFTAWRLGFWLAWDRLEQHIHLGPACGVFLIGTRMVSIRDTGTNSYRWSASGAPGQTLYIEKSVTHTQ